MLRQELESIKMADVCLFVIDGICGVLDGDIEVFNILRKNNKKSILLVNKAENPDKLLTDDLYKINCEKKILVSAEHNLGFDDLYKVLLPEYEKWQLENKNNDNTPFDVNNSTESFQFSVSEYKKNWLGVKVEFMQK